MLERALCGMFEESQVRPVSGKCRCELHLEANSTCSKLCVGWCLEVLEGLPGLQFIVYASFKKVYVLFGEQSPWPLL